MLNPIYSTRINVAGANYRVTFYEGGAARVINEHKNVTMEFATGLASRDAVVKIGEEIAKKLPRGLKTVQFMMR